MKILRKVMMIMTTIFGGIYATTDPFVQMDRMSAAIAYMAQVMRAAAAADANKVTDTPVAQCVVCKKTVIGFAIASALVSGQMIEDLKEGKDTFDEMKLRLDVCLALFANGNSDEIASFVLCAGNDLKYPCPSCKGTSWEKISASL